MHHHSRLREGEGQERAHGKQRNEPVRDAAEDDQQQAGEHGKDADAHGVDQPPPPIGEGMGQKVVFAPAAGTGAENPRNWCWPRAHRTASTLPMVT